MDLALKNRSVVVTGGNRGIGRAIALAFADEGANVSIVARDKDALAKVKAEIEAKGVKAHAISADLFTAEGCKRAIDETAEAFGGLDVLVNNASTSVSGGLETLTDEQLMERLTGKTLAYMRCCRAALPWFRKRGGGRIICIGGGAARKASKSSLPSGLGNSALTNFARHLSDDIAPENMTINVVHPPFTKTDRYPKRLEARASNSASVWRKRRRPSSPTSPSAVSWRRRTSRRWCCSWPRRTPRPSRGRRSASTAAPSRGCSTKPAYRQP